MPLPSVRSSVSYLTAPAETITHVTDKPEKKKGRPSKAEKQKALRAKASDAVRMLLDSEPKKSDIMQFLRGRIEELEDGF
jgi:hypothetical protein